MKKNDANADREKRLQWWHEARLGLFVHYGLYSQLGRGEWVMNRERIPLRRYERLTRTFRPKKDCAREWVKIACKAGMKYVVLTTKHHDGFCLWDSKQTSYNAARRGPRRDLIREYVDACRDAGLRVGFYYSLMDWHHPDGLRCMHGGKARRRFLDYTQGCVRELMSQYGKIDILWYDIALPLDTAEQWESAKLNAMARALQPGVLINSRSYLPEDFDVSENCVSPSPPGRAWECCTTTATGWGYMPTPPDEWMSGRKMVRELQSVVAGGGNFLVNIGPMGDGTIPPEGAKQFARFGRWVRRYGEAVYGRIDRTGVMEGTFCGAWTRKGSVGYYWVTTWPGEELAIGGIETKVRSVALMPGGAPLRFRQEANRVIVRGLPKRCPDRICEIGMLRFAFAGKDPRQRLGPCMVPI